MSCQSPIVGTVLAAGLSERMGRPKALLKCATDGETFVASVVRALREGGILEVLVIGRPEDDALRQAVARLECAARFVENADANGGQLSSLLAAITEAERKNAAGVLVMPVDMPLVRSATIAAVLTAFQSSGAAIVRATHRSRHGHPVIFSARMFDELRNADASVGARSVLRAHAHDVLDVEVDDPGVLRDIDFRADYRDVFGHDPE